MAPLQVVQTKRRALTWCAFWKLEKLWRSTTLSIKSKIQLFNTTCITIFLWMWILGDLLWHGKRDQLICHHMLQSQHQAKWLHTKCHDLHHDKHKTTTAASKIPATEISWTHPSPARRRTGKNICPLCANAWKTTSWPPAFFLPVLHTTLTRGWGNNIWPSPYSQSCTRSQLMEGRLWSPAP